MTSATHFPNYVRFNEERCTGCAACLRVCPTKAIRIRHHRSIRIVTQCIGCGACIQTCPAGAVSAATRRPEHIGDDHVAVALVSPVLYAQYPGTMPGGVLMGLRQMGFTHTIDMSFFLEMFQWATDEFIRRNRVSGASPWPLISPICPVVVRLIAFRFPGLLAHVLPVLRPVALMAREVQEQILPGYAETGRKVVLYYINPCPTLAVPPPDPLAAPPLRCSTAIGINEIYPELKRRIETVLSSDRIPFSGTHFEFETCSTANAALGAVSGGEIANLDVEKSLAVHGMEETISYLHKIEMGLLKDVEYIEFRTCREGCIGGVLAAVDKYVAKRTVQKMVSVFGLGNRLPRESIRHLYDKGRFQPDKSPMVLTHLFGTRISALSLGELERIERTLDVIEGRDCGACGAPDCRTLAEDIVRGEASLNDCIWLHARRMEKKALPADAGDD